ncbi:hypothetical protein ERO13_A06G140333v2 [Gossypium hirsutum]|nr:hypothetical protein ERO13_A06G140333v2 [Gossypium hirsutum]
MGFPGLLSTIMLIVVLIMLLANRNPLYLMGLFVVYLLSKAMWVRGQFQHGTLAGLISISSRFLPTIMNLLRRLAEEAQGHQTAEPPRQQCSLVFQSLKNQSHPNPTDSIPESSVASNISTSDGGIEYSSPNVTHGSTKIPEAELS